MKELPLRFCFCPNIEISFQSRNTFSFAQDNTHTSLKKITNENYSTWTIYYILLSTDISKAYITKFHCSLVDKHLLSLFNYFCHGETV